MGRRKNGQPPPVILLISPTQFATKFMTQEDKPQIAARLKVRKVGPHGGFEVPVTIQNPEFKPEKAIMEGDGKKKHHLFGKKARKIIRKATKAAEVGAAVTAAVPGLEEFAMVCVPEYRDCCFFKSSLTIICPYSPIAKNDDSKVNVRI